MENNKTPITLLDILTHAKSRGAKTLQEAMNITAKLNNEVTSDSQMTPYEAETLLNLLNKYSIVHWSIDEDSDTRTVFRNNLNQNNRNMIIVKKNIKPYHLTMQPDYVLIKELEDRGYIVTKKTND